jgi:hypothetical protein
MRTTTTGKLAVFCEWIDDRIYNHFRCTASANRDLILPCMAQTIWVTSFPFHFSCTISLYQILDNAISIPYTFVYVYLLCSNVKHMVIDHFKRSSKPFSCWGIFIVGVHRFFSWLIDTAWIKGNTRIKIHVDCFLTLQFHIIPG